MFATTTSTVIQVPPEEAYRYLADFRRHNEWSLGVEKLEPTTNGTEGVGSEFKADETVPVKFTSYSRITALDPPHRISWESWDGRMMHVDWTFELEPAGNMTTVTQRSEFQPTSIAGRVMLNLIRKRQIPKENHQSMERIKKILEASDES